MGPCVDSLLDRVIKLEEHLCCVDEDLDRIDKVVFQNDLFYYETLNKMLIEEIVKLRLQLKEKMENVSQI